MSELIGRKLGQYELRSVLGHGGMATVYRAHQESVGRDVAVKVIESKLAHNPDFTKRFEREARTIAALSHTHLLKIFDYGRQENLIYLVMELLPGGSLAEEIKRGPLALPAAAQMLEQIGSALEYAHSKGIIHRDLKPQNVLLDEQGNAILTDFGIAKLLNETTALTQSGMAMGTPLYMSPEQCQGGAVDARSDLYSLGIMLFEMLTGDVPFKSDTPVSLLYMHLSQPPPSVRGMRPDLPEGVERVILKALAKQPNARFQSAREMVSAFRIAITGEMPPGLESIDPSGERTAPLVTIEGARAQTQLGEEKAKAPRQGRRGILTVGALGLLLLMGIAAILLAGRGGGEVFAPTTTPSTTIAVVAANPTETASATATPTFTLTMTASPSMTVTASATDTTAPTATVTETLAPSLTPSETLDPIKAAETLFLGGLTQTAALWTATPTETFTASPDFTETVGARLTEIAVASYTKTPSPTLTLSPSTTASMTLPSVSIGDLTSTALYLSATAVSNLSARPDVSIIEVLPGMDPIVLDRATHQVAVLFTVMVTNTGTAPAPTFEVTIRLSDGTSFSTRTALILEPNAKGIVRLYVTFVSEGTQQVVVVADSGGAIPDEGDRSNNQMTLEVMVNSPSPEVPTLIPAGTSNTVWTPQDQGFNGVTMVLVPAGCFRMGSDSGEPDEKPVHEVCFEQPFWIDKWEVFQWQFQKFNGQAAVASRFRGDSLPVEQITWFEAKAFCEKRDARLPTEAEWEYAARGPESLNYPWGNEFVADNVIYALNSFDRTGAGGSRAGGASWVGAQDMSGNVWEWTSSLYQSYPYNADDGREANTGQQTNVLRVVRGGSWSDRLPDLLRAAYRSNFDTPDGRTNSRGFRCVRSFEDMALLSTEPTPLPAAATPTPAGTSNTVWTPQTQDFNGVTMVLVPAGCFRMGSDDGDSEEKPVQEVCFEQPYWIDQTEVTQAQFKQLGGKAAQASFFTGDSLPRENITWFEARDFCAQRGGHLPTEAEWEYAARGPQGLIFPWGNEFDADKVIYGANSDKQTATVGSKPGGVSWVGALDMSGNVWEWMSSLYQAYPYKNNDGRESTSDASGDRVLRGGGWLDDVNYLRAAVRKGGVPSGWVIFIGFRCARAYN